MPKDHALQQKHDIPVASHIGITEIMLRRAEIANVDYPGIHRDVNVGILAPLKYQPSAAGKGHADLEHRVPPFEVGMVHRITTGQYLNGSKSTYPIGSGRSH